MKLVLNGKCQTLGVRPEPQEVEDWWRWILSFDKANNPLKGVDVYQSLPLICLSCTGGGEDMERRLQICGEDIEKFILIPIFTSEYSTAEMGSDTSDEELLSHARDDVKDPKYLELTIEGQSIQGIKHFYVEAGPFVIRLPNNHILDDSRISPGTYRAMCAGYWMKLKPIRGQEKFVIQFGGTGQNGFHTRVRYTVDLPSHPIIVNSVKTRSVS